jgi:hypothetical protein
MLRAARFRNEDRIGSFIRREPLREVYVVEAEARRPDAGATLDVDRLEACLGRLREGERMVVLL